MSPKKRILVELLALSIATATVALSMAPGFASKSNNSEYLNAFEARAESALYLDALPTKARLHRAAGRWQVTDGQATAWLDARTGELIEIELDPRR